MKKVLLVIGIVIIAASCSKGGGVSGSASGDYVAKVDNVKLTKEEVRVAWDVLPVMAKQVFEGPNGTARFVDEMVRRESLYIEAKKRGLDQDKEVQMRLEEARKNALAGYLLRKVGEDVSPLTGKDMRDYYDAHKDYFIIKGTLSPYEEVKAALSQRMVAERRKAAIDKLLDSVKKSYKVDINKAAVAQLPPLLQPDNGNMPLPHGHPSLPAH